MLKLAFGIYQCPKCYIEFNWQSGTGIDQDCIICPSCRHDLTPALLKAGQQASDVQRAAEQGFSSTGVK